MNSSTVVQKLWNYCRGPGLGQASPVLLASKSTPIASFLANNRVVFNIKGDGCRLVVAVHYKRGLMFVRFVGTHREYDRIDAATV